MDAGAVVSLVQTLLQDDGTRWPETELFAWIDDAQRFIASAAPDFLATIVPLPLIAGAEQSLPAAYFGLHAILRNADGSFPRKVDGEALALADPLWRSKPATTAVRQYFSDAADAAVFYVCPPSAGATVTARCYARPTPIVDSNTALSVADELVGAVVDYVVYRAFSKDAEIPANAARAETAFDKCTAALGLSNKTKALIQAQAIEHG